MKKNILAKQIAFYIILVIVWQVISMSDILPSHSFPSPYEVGESLVYMASDGSLFFGIGTTLMRLVIGLTIAIAIGVFLGIFMARVEVVIFLGFFILVMIIGKSTPCSNISLIAIGSRIFIPNIAASLASL